MFPGPQGSSLCVSPHGHLLTPPGGGFWGKREELLPAPNALKMGLPPPTPHHSSLFCPLSRKKEVPLRIVITGIVCVCVYDSAPFYVICVFEYIYVFLLCLFSKTRFQGVQVWGLVPSSDSARYLHPRRARVSLSMESSWSPACIFFGLPSSVYHRSTSQRTGH